MTSATPQSPAHQSAQSPAPAAFALTGGRVYTGNAAAPWASAIGVQDGKIVAVGTADEVAAALPPGVSVRELGGGFVMPGLIDAHNHHALAGKSELTELAFSPTASLDELLTRVAAYAQTLPADGWLLGGSWGSGLQTEIATEASLARLDAAAGGRAVILTDDSKHNRWVSSRALELAGMAPGVAAERGQIMFDPQTGGPTGVLLEAAGLPVEEARAATYQLTAEQHRACSQRGIEILGSYGITSFQDAAASLPMLEALRDLDHSGELDAWVVTSLTINDDIFGYDVIGTPLLERGEEFRTEYHRPDFVKIFLDGVPPARTASFLEPFVADDAHGDHFCGTTTMPPEELEGWLREVSTRGLGAKIHCTGDGSVRLVLDTVERLRAEGFTDTKFQIAHGQFVHPDDVPRFAALGVIAEISPFIWFPGVIPDAIAQVLPAERARRMQPNRDLLDAGALVVGGSDWPVSESPNPWEGIEGLVTRADPTRRFPGTLWPEQAISLDEALRAFTLDAARALGLDTLTGSLEVGKSADFVVTDRDPFEIPVGELAQVNARETWFAGRQVFAAE